MYVGKAEEVKEQKHMDNRGRKGERRQERKASNEQYRQGNRAAWGKRR